MKIEPQKKRGGRGRQRGKRRLKEPQGVGSTHLPGQTRLCLTEKRRELLE